jgi:AAA+ ATPase superfamily predicted ATPase
VRFLNRENEMERLDALVTRGGGFAAVHGRRRIGKTRLLVEWVRRHGGVYTVADQSAADVQRRYLAEAVATRLPGFADVAYRDWRALLTRLARDAAAAGWRGPFVLDELPYLVVVSPELPAILQRWIDHEAADLVVVVAGSSQHMMRGLVLDGDAPLYGRAREILEIKPLDPRLLPDALGLGAVDAVEAFTAWGGVPRYWELASDVRGPLSRRLDHLVLDPLGALHREPDRLIVEELPPATEVRALLDVIGSGAHKVSEIAGRLGRPATSLSRPLQRLQGMGLVHREVPFGEDERASKRSRYRIADPFTRLWFRVVAPHRALLATATDAGRLGLLRTLWPQLLGEGWEDLCRLLVPRLDPGTPVGALGSWGPASRWWRGGDPEWDMVSRSLDGRRILLGEAKVSVRSVPAAMKALASRPLPSGLPDDVELVRALFVASAKPGPGVVTAMDLLVPGE